MRMAPSDGHLQRRKVAPVSCTVYCERRLLSILRVGWGGGVL